MAKYEQICKGDSQGVRKYAKYCKKKAQRSTSKRIVNHFIQGNEKRALGENQNAKSMSGWTN